MRLFQFISGIAITSLLLLMILPSQVIAWNKAGHMVSAAIAYSDLKERDPQALKRIVHILRQLPSEEFRAAVKQAKNDGHEEGFALFIFAARWPDDVRGNKDEDRPMWHFINHPYKPANAPNWVTTVGPKSPNIEEAFRDNIQAVTSSSSSVQKARSLCWIFHLMGDAHQPLHAASLYSETFRTEEGDRGGTRFYVKTSRRSRETMSLHSYWDRSVIKYEDVSIVAEKARSLRGNNPPSAFNEIGSGGFEDWIQESYGLAKKYAYRDGVLAGSRNDSAGTGLPSDYRTSITPTAERRVVLAGYRISELLSRNF